MPKIDAKINNNVDVNAVILRVLEIEGKALTDCMHRLRQEENARVLKLAVELMEKALEQGGKIIVTGVGKSGKVGQKIAATLSSTGSLAVFLHPTEGLHGDLGLVTSRDVVLALSYTGNTEELMRLLPSLKGLGVKIIAIGGNKYSMLAEKCDAWIDAFVEQEACPNNLAPTASTTLALALGDALAVALMRLRGFDSRSFAQNHPGGSLGNRLNLRVADVMHRQDAIGVLSASASMDDVIITLTAKKMGAVLIADGKKLLGIITDGDLRRALHHREQFFQLKAESIMSRNPIVVQPEVLAKEALDLMENRPSQISVLPVVDAAGNWEGLVRVHDLAKTF